MSLKVLLTGDVNLMNVTDPAGPFAQVAAGSSLPISSSAISSVVSTSRTPLMRLTERDFSPRSRRPKR